MIEYLLKDKDDNTYDLNSSSVTVELSKSWSQGNDSFEYRNKVVERTYLPGSVKVGDSRLKDRVLTFKVHRTDDSSSNYRSDLNELLEFIAKTKYIVDVTNDMQIEVAIESIDVEYDRGTEKQYSENIFEFKALTPYWQALTVTQITGTTIADTIKEVAISNLGYLPSPPIITLVTTAAVDSIQMYLSSSTEGIQIDDAVFGTAGNLTMIVDCISGEVTIGALNVNASIAVSTGFFSFPVGADTLNILGADVAVSYTIDFYKRYFI